MDARTLPVLRRGIESALLARLAQRQRSWRFALVFARAPLRFGPVTALLYGHGPEEPSTP